MINIEINHITIGDDKFPVYCDMHVMTEIQKKYESISEFERKLIGKEVVHDENGDPVYEDDGITIKKKMVDPDISTMLDAMYLMIKEGQRVESRQGAEEGSRTEPITMEELEMAQFTGTDYITLSTILHAVMMKCFITKKNTESTKTTKSGRKKNTTT